MNGGEGGGVRHGLPKQWALKPTIQKPFRYDAFATVLGSLLGR